MNHRPLDRRHVVKALLAGGDDLLVVAGLGACAWDVTAAGDRDLNFPMWGGMGQAAVIGLGLALAQPGRPVLTVTGDGEMLMGLGSLATLALHKPPNLALVVLDNARYGETGNQESHTAFGVDLVGVAAACGLTDCRTIERMDAVEALSADLRRSGGTIFARVIIDDDEPPRVMPPRDAVHLKTRFQMALGVI